MNKKAYDISLLSKEQKSRLSLSPQLSSLLGINHETLIEPLPNIIEGKSEKWIKGANNSAISLGRDRPGSLGSGYSAETGAGQIDLVAGYSSSEIKRSNTAIAGNNVVYSVDPNISLDAARIMISQKTDVDENFRIADGSVGNVKNKSAITLKADSIRVIGREGIKFVTGVDKVNSGGAVIRSVPRIDFIAGNKQQKSEPATLSSTNNKAIDSIWKEINKLNQMVDVINQHQAEFNLELASHQHYDLLLMLIGLIADQNPFLINDGKTLPSPEVVEAAIKHVPSQLIAKLDGIMQSMKIVFANTDITNPAGSSNPKSRSVRMN